MHEMFLAMSIVEQTRAAAAAEGADRVLEVEIEVGSLAGVMLESLEFCLEAAARSTPVADTDFRLLPVMASGRCSSCRNSFEVDSFFAPCPACGKVDLAITGGRELKIRSLTIED
ncbi:MAG: hydrogenase maturation nickel metallochaperone HypA [Desulfobulbales bacterium]|nr:hydrogenase maturation nickel metallochaperone HypA [Desulfobulbales bacterium]